MKIWCMQQILSHKINFWGKQHLKLSQPEGMEVLTHKTHLRSFERHFGQEQESSLKEMWQDSTMEIFQLYHKGQVKTIKRKSSTALNSPLATILAKDWGVAFLNIKPT